MRIKKEIITKAQQTVIGKVFEDVKEIIDDLLYDRGGTDFKIITDEKIANYNLIILQIKNFIDKIKENTINEKEINNLLNLLNKHKVLPADKQVDVYIQNQEKLARIKETQ